MGRKLTHITRIGKAGAWTLAWIGNSLAALWLLAAAYGGMVDPATSVIGALTAMTFPIILVITIVLIVVNLVFFKRIALLNAASLIACAGPFFTYCPINFTSGDLTEENKANAFSLVTYNVYRFNYVDERYDGESPNRTIQYLLDKDADIVCLQEARRFDVLDRWRYNPEQFDSIRQRYPHRLISWEGMSIMSKYPVDSIKVNKPKTDKEKFADFVCFRVWIKGRKLYIFNVHLQSIGLTSTDKELYEQITRSGIDRSEISQARHQIVTKLDEAFRRRAEQARELRRAVDSITGGRDVIICGDFNDIPGCFATRVARGTDMTDAYTHAGFGPAITYHANRFYFRIDHMFYRGDDLEAIYIERSRINSSDHYPLYAIFEWD